jgi:hypothetical protein
VLYCWSWTKRAQLMCLPSITRSFSSFVNTGVLSFFLFDFDLYRLVDFFNLHCTVTGVGELLGYLFSLLRRNESQQDFVVSHSLL